MGKQLIIPLARLSFETLGEPEGYQGKPPRRWGATFLVPADDPAKAMIDAAIVEVAKEKWGAKFAPILAEILLDKKGCAWIDGARKGYDGYEGMWAMSAYRYEDKGRPLVLDNDASPIYKPDNSLYEGKAGRLYGGCWVRAQVELWTQDNSNGKGIRASLLQLQRIKAGDSFGGGAAPQAGVFGEVADGIDDEALG